MSKSGPSDPMKDPYYSYFLKFRNSCQIDDLPLVQDAALSACNSNFVYDSLEEPLGACIEKQDPVARASAFTLTDKNRSCSNSKGKLCSSTIFIEGVRKSCVSDQGCQYFFKWFFEVGRVEGFVGSESVMGYSGQTDFTWGSSCYVPVGATSVQTSARLKQCLQKQKYEFIEALYELGYEPKQKISFEKALQYFDLL